MANSKAESQKTYGEMSAQLDEILAWFDSTEVDLDEAMSKYQEALKLIEQMEAYLKTAENKVRKISSEQS